MARQGDEEPLEVGRSEACDSWLEEEEDSPGKPPLSSAEGALSSLDAERALRLRDLSCASEALQLALGAGEACPAPRASWSTVREPLDHASDAPPHPPPTRLSDHGGDADADQALHSLLEELERLDAAEEEHNAIAALAARLSAVVAASALARAQEELSSRAAAALSLRRAWAARVVVRRACGCPLLLRFHERRAAAATRMQAHARGMAARKTLRSAAAGRRAEAGAALRAKLRGEVSAAERLRAQHAAACALQRAWRGHAARAELAAARARAKAATAAVTVQSVWRGFSLRSRLAHAMRAIAAMQLHATATAPDARLSSGASAAPVACPVLDEEFPAVDADSFLKPLLSPPPRAPTPTPDPAPAAASAVEASAEGCGAAAIEAPRSAWEEAELRRRAAVERAKRVWGWASDDVAGAFVRAAARTKALHAKHSHTEKMRDPQSRLEYLQRRTAHAGAPARSASPVKRAATAAAPRPPAAPAPPNSAVAAIRAAVKAVPSLLVNATVGKNGSTAVRFNEGAALPRGSTAPIPGGRSGARAG